MGFKFIVKDRLSRLPKNPGVYCFKKGREILYIGKATNLRERVKNHFHPVKYREAVIPLKAGLFNRVKQIGYLKTDSEIEALILEANLIKKCQPKFNVVWRDDKNYFFVAVTREDFPRIFWTHQKKIKNPAPTSGAGRGQKSKIKNIFIGPFVEGAALKQTLKVLRRVFPYRSCKTLPNRPCLWYQLNRCPAPCLLKSKIAQQVPEFQSKMKKECKANAKNLIKILQGKKKQVLNNLKREMKVASKLEDFEKAAKIRDQITALEKVLAHAKIFTQYVGPGRSPLFYVWKRTERKLKEILKIENKISRIEAYDISNIVGQQATGSMVTFIDGQPNKNFYRKFKIRIGRKPNDIAMITEVLTRRFKHPEWGLPDLILIDGGKAQLNATKLTIKKQKAAIPVIALAKKENKLFIESKKKLILLKNLPREIFNLILQLRDESHRFAITYHKKLREIDLRKGL